MSKKRDLLLFCSLLCYTSKKPTIIDTQHNFCIEYALLLSL